MEEPKMIKLQLCTALITVPEAKAKDWEKQGWKRVEAKGPFVPTPHREEGKAVFE
jgi:hypothetical protein